MAIVGAFDVHRRQLTFDYLDTGSGELTRGRITPAHRATVRDWLVRFDGVDVDFGLEGCTGWRYIVEELQAGFVAHLAEPADTAARRGKKKRAKTDKADARHLRDLLVAGAIPESWIPPAHPAASRQTWPPHRPTPGSPPRGGSPPQPPSANPSAGGAAPDEPPSSLGSCWAGRWPC